MSTGLTAYFAYGSNLGLSALRTRCPSARQIGIARAEGYRIGFTRTSKTRGGGVADLVPASGSVVWGSIFDLCHDDFDALDTYEGVPKAYTREVRDFATPDGSRISAWVYTVVSKAIETPPSQAYWKLLVGGAREAGLPPEYVRGLEAIAHST